MLRAELGFQPVCELRLDLFLAVEESLDAAFTRLRLIGIERALDAAQRDMERDPHLFPAFDQRPIHRT